MLSTTSTALIIYYEAMVRESCIGQLARHRPLKILYIPIKDGSAKNHRNKVQYASKAAMRAYWLHKNGCKDVGY